MLPYVILRLKYVEVLLLRYLQIEYMKGALLQ